MKRRLVAALVRLYPSRWRAEYGEELADVLMRRPLGVGAVVNVVVGAVRQHELWLIVGVPLVLWIVIRWALVLTDGLFISRRGAPELGLAIFFGVGLWTVARYGHGGVRAALKLATLIAVPYCVLGILTLMQVLRIVDGSGDTLGFRLYGPANERTLGVQLFLTNQVLAIPVAGLLGWVGGLTGHIARRLAR